MWFLTDFADQAVVMPLAAAVAVAIWLSGWRRGALAWALTVALTFAAVAAAKIAVFAFGTPDSLPGLQSPSGHTASAALIYGGLVAMLANRTAPQLRTILVAVLFAVTIGFTRLSLEVHTRADVMVGAAIGITGAMMLSWLAGERPEAMKLRLPAGAVAVVILLFHGLHMPAEVWLHAAADTVRTAVN